MALTKMFEERQRAMRNEELIKIAKIQMSDLAKTFGKSFIMTIPPRVDDTDMVYGEVLRRFEEAINKTGPVQGAADYLVANFERMSSIEILESFAALKVQEALQSKWSQMSELAKEYYGDAILVAIPTNEGMEYDVIIAHSVIHNADAVAWMPIPSLNKKP